MATSVRPTASKPSKKSLSESVTAVNPAPYPDGVKDVREQGDGRYLIQFDTDPSHRLAGEVRFEQLWGERDAADAKQRSSPPNYYLISFLFNEAQRISRGQLQRDWHTERQFCARAYRHLKERDLPTMHRPKEEFRDVDEGTPAIPDYGEPISVTGKRRFLVHEISPRDENCEFFVVRVPRPVEESEPLLAKDFDEVVQAMLRAVSINKKGKKRGTPVEKVRMNALLTLSQRNDHFDRVEEWAKSLNLLTNRKRRNAGGVRNAQDELTRMLNQIIDEIRRDEEPATESQTPGLDEACSPRGRRKITHEAVSLRKQTGG